jgi:hypothetical protein
MIRSILLPGTSGLVAQVEVRDADLLKFDEIKRLEQIQQALEQQDNVNEDCYDDPRVEEGEVAHYLRRFGTEDF